MAINLFARLGLAGVLALCATYGLAQNIADSTEWSEEAVPPPPAFSKDKLIPLDMPGYIALKLGVDPQTIEVGRDGVVRYVLVMVNASGNSSAVFEGIRCETGEVKTYARLNASGDWSPLEHPAWKDLNSNMPSHHALVLSRQGACLNRLTNSKEEILKLLKAGQLSTQTQKFN